MLLFNFKGLYLGNKLPVTKAMSIFHSFTIYYLLLTTYYLCFANLHLVPNHRLARPALDGTFHLLRAG